VLSGSVALAEPAGAPSFVPVTLDESRAPEESVVVEPGDHLWKISASHLEQVFARPAEPAEIDPYWRAVIEVNQALISSGDPDLIYPGEVISLPATG
ncbi:MAG: LysM peptidoglycan-binding domain-containing protein, partial [Acidimicrobiia bacterium]